MRTSPWGSPCRNSAVSTKPLPAIERHWQSDQTMPKCITTWEALMDRRQTRRSDRQLSPSCTYKPDYAEAHRQLGQLLQILGRLGDAEQSYRQAVRPNQKTPKTTTILARFWKAWGNRRQPSQVTITRWRWHPKAPRYITIWVGH